MIPFILHWPSLFFCKVSNSQNKVLITPGLYFPNYCVTYLPRDISRAFNKCEHVTLRREKLYYTANNQKIADKKKVDYQEGLEKSRADSAARSRDSYMKDPEKSCSRTRESYMKNQEKSRAQARGSVGSEEPPSQIKGPLFCNESSTFWNKKSMHLWKLKVHCFTQLHHNFISNTNLSLSLDLNKIFSSQTSS